MCVCVCVCVCVSAALAHLSDLLKQKSEQPDVKQHLPPRGHHLKVHYQHRRIQEEEGEIRHHVPVKLHLRTAVQATHSGPDTQLLFGLQAMQMTANTTTERQLKT